VYEHVSIRRPEFVAGGRGSPEMSILVQTHKYQLPPPSGQICSGDRVWLKWSGGPIVSAARVSGFRELAECSTEQVRETARGFGLCNLDRYWREVDRRYSEPFYAIVIYLRNAKRLDTPVHPTKRLSRGASWVIVRPGTVDGWATKAPGRTPPIGE